MNRPVPISVVIPTYQREAVLVDTIRALLKNQPTADEIIIVDQTVDHEILTDRALRGFHAEGKIRWLRLTKPSIPHAMNTGLIAATNEVVLFLDDDIEPGAELFAAHMESYEDETVAAAVGQVLQPGEQPSSIEGKPAFGLRTDLDFPFNSTTWAFIRNAMAGNLSVRRDLALAVGGFDENFVGVAYRFETEFARRVDRLAGKVLFQPRAGIRHLRAERGGTRASGNHLTSASPAHGVGDYYFALREGRGWERIRYIVKRPIREVLTRFHLRHPWWIPVKVVGELRALHLAVRLWRRGPALVTGGSLLEARPDE